MYNYFKATVQFMNALKPQLSKELPNEGFTYVETTTYEPIMTAITKLMALVKTLQEIEKKLSSEKSDNFEILAIQVTQISIYELKEQEEAPQANRILFFEWVNQQPPTEFNAEDILTAYAQQKDEKGNFTNKK